MLMPIGQRIPLAKIHLLHFQVICNIKLQEDRVKFANFVLNYLRIIFVWISFLAFTEKWQQKLVTCNTRHIHVYYSH